MIEPIKLPEKAIKNIREGERQIAEINRSLTNYLQGLALGLSIPEDWVFNKNLMMFVPPEKPKEEPEETPCPKT